MFCVQENMLFQMALRKIEVAIWKKIDDVISELIIMSPMRIERQKMRNLKRWQVRGFFQKERNLVNDIV